MIYVVYAIFTWIVVLVFIKYPGYSPRTTLMSLKAGPVEHLLVLLIFFYGTDNTRDTVWLFRRIVWLVIVGNVITVVDAFNIPDLGLISEREDGRVGGTFGSSNEYGVFLALFLPSIFAIYMTSTGLKKLLSGVGAAVSCLAFLMALSRGAVVGLAVGGVIGAFYLRNIIPPRVIVRAGFVTILLCLAVVAGGFAAGYGDLVIERFGQFGEGSFRASSGRTVIWSRALDSMLEHPVTFVSGFGWGAYSSDRYFSYATHNTYLNIGYNLGMIGVVLFLLTVRNVLSAIRAPLDRARSEIRPLLIAFLFGFLALLVAIFFGELHSAWLFTWAFVGIALRLAALETGVETNIVENVRRKSAAKQDKKTTGQVQLRVPHI